MNERGISEMDVADLVERYVQLSLQQKAAADVWKVAEVNRLFDQIHRIGDELGRRPGDQRSVLIKLFAHPNLDVQFNAATSVMSIAPVEARRQMQAIADSKQYPVAGRAGMYLLMLDGKYSK